MEHLGLLVTRDGVKPINIKIEAITNMAPPTSQKRITKVYRCNEILPQYTAKAVTYISAFN